MPPSDGAEPQARRGRGTAAEEVPLYALVQFPGEVPQAVEQVIGPFPDEHDAKRFAAAHRLGGCTVGPLRFAALLAPPGGLAHGVSRAHADLETAPGWRYLRRARLDGNDPTRPPRADAAVTWADLVGLIGDLLDGCELVARYLAELREGL